MSGVRFKVTLKFGRISPAAPTGEWVIDPDGWWRPLMMDSVWYDEDGREIRREPCEALVRLSEPPHA